MGGKHKGANRTKNNARPSSSGRSVELLGSNLPAFGVFSGSGTSFGFNLDLVDSSFQLALKKISKKDSTTKSKGLQEFKDLIKNSEPDVVKAMLPTWCRFYNVLSTDTNNRVREETHQVHHEIVLKVKRNLAPFLKQLMPPWFTSQYDTYPPAATAATLAFQDAFPVHKSQDVIVFCQSEILSYIYDILLVQTVQSLSPKNASPEDAESKHIRALTSCLQGYCLYLEKIEPDKIQEASEANQQITSNAKFWKFAKYSTPSVRSAWFKAVKNICQKAIFLIRGQEAQLLTTLFNNLEEEDPTVLPHVWECVLLAVSEIEDWWKFVNVEKLFVPKLMNVLKKAGLGNANLMYPSILPLISYLPPLKDELQFYNNFFSSFVIGLKLKSVVSSRSESLAVSSAFVECIRYIIVKNSTNTDLCKTLLSKHLLPVIEWCITSNNSCDKIVSKQTAIFLQYLSKNNQSDAVNLLLKEFFVDVEKMFGNILLDPSVDAENILSIAQKQIEFVSILKNNQKLSKSIKVKFATEDDAKKSTQKTTKNVEPNGDIFYRSLLQSLEINLSAQYSVIIEEKRNKGLIDKLCCLIFNSNSRSFFDYLLEKDKKQENCTLIYFYDNMLKNWLNSEDLSCESVVGLIFLLFCHLDDKNKTTLLGDLIKVERRNCLQWCISESLGFPYSEDPLIKLWLKSKEIGDFFVCTTDKIISSDCSAELKALYRLALTEDEDGDLPISVEALQEIVAKVSKSLSQLKIDTISSDPCLSLASYLCTIVYSENFLLKFRTDLLLALFEQACKIYKESESISRETIFEVDSTWQDTIRILFAKITKADVTNVTEKFAKIIENEFLASENFNFEQMCHISEVISDFLNVCFKTVPLISDNLKNAMFKRKWLHNRKEDISLLCSISKYLDVNIPSEPLKTTVNISEFEILQYFTWSYVQLKVLTSEVKEDNDDDDDDESDEDEKKEKAIMLSMTDDGEQQISNILEDYVLGEMFVCYFSNVKYYEEVFQYNTLLGDELLKVFIKKGFVDQTINSIIKSMNLPFSLKYASLDDDVSEITGQEIQRVFGEIEVLKNENQSLFLLKDVPSEDWGRVDSVIKSIRQCSMIVDSKNVKFFEKKYWDLIVLSLVSWSEYCYKSRASLDKIQYQAISIAVAKLYKTVSDTINKRVLLKVYVDEWEDILCEEIHKNLSQVWLYASDELSNRIKSQKYLSYVPFIQNFGVVTGYLRSDFIFKANDNSPKWTKFFKRSCSLLTSCLPSVQVWGYKMLLTLVPGFIKLDLEAVRSNTPHQKGLVLEQLKTTLLEIQEVVTSIVSDFRLGEETCKIVSFTDASTYTIAYLLLWDVLLTLCQHASADLRYQYTDRLKSEGVLKAFLSSLLYLIPDEVLRCSKTKSDPSTAYFTQNPLDDACFSKQLDASFIEQMSCYLYKTSLTQLPALVRQWWTDLEPRLSQVVEKITSLYVSPILCSEELSEVLKHQQQYKNMTIHIMPSVREILAVYTVDEAQMELTITLPANYPLGSPQVECNRPIVGTDCGGWLLQFKKCVCHQNGRLSDGLSLWYNNLDRKFDGVEECCICFAVLHTGTYQLPRLTCQTCKKKFHSACLYKWFSTSYKSSCPICRNLF